MSIENFQPGGERVLVEIEPVPETTKSGLYLAQSNHVNAPKRGTVVAIGPDCAYYEVDDIVLLDQRTGVEIEVRDSENDFLLVLEEQVLGRYR